MGATFSASAIFKAIDQVTAPVRAMTNSVHTMSMSWKRDMAAAGNQIKSFKANFGGITQLVGTASIIAFGQKSIQAFGDSEAAIANVKAGIISTRDQLKITTDQFQKMAANFQKMSIFEDDSILQNVTAQLQTFTNIGSKNFNRVQQAALDVTSKIKGINATGEDLRATAIMIGKGMQDPIRGLTNMRKVGISFSEQTARHIKMLVAQGKVEKAQVVMLKEIEKQYGGTAKALAETAKGMELMQKNAIGDQMERLGKALLPIKESLLRISMVGVKFLNFLVSTPAGTIILSMVAAWKAYKIYVLAAAAAELYRNTIAVKGLSQTQMWAAAIGAVVGLISVVVLNWNKYSDSTKRWIIIAGAAVGIIGTVITLYKTWTAAQWLLNIAMTANPVGAIIVVVAALIAGIVLLIKHWDKVKKKMDEWSNSAIYQLITIANPLYKIIEFIGFMQDRWQAIKKAFQDKGLLGGIMAIGKAIISFILKPIEVILKAVGKLTGWKWATNLSNSIGNVRSIMDHGMVQQKDQTAPVNPTKAQANYVQKQITDTRTTQNVQIDINDPGGLAKITGSLQPIPINVRSTKGGIGGS